MTSNFNLFFRKGDLIGIEVSFSNIGDSFFTLFRCSTGEDWYIIMYDLMNYNCDSQICKSIFFLNISNDWNIFCCFYSNLIICLAKFIYPRANSII